MSKNKSENAAKVHIEPEKRDKRRINSVFYEKELRKLQIELVKVQEWVKAKGLKVVVILKAVMRRVKGAL